MTGDVNEAASEHNLVTVLKADISGSTALGERLDPEELRAVLGSYFAALAREIQRQQGLIDKYIGDAVVAVFGLPAPRPDDAVRAVTAALGMQEAIQRENEALEARYGVRLACRIGVDTGEVVAGAVAGDVQEADTVIGETVTIAEKLEAAAALNTVLVSESTYDATRDDFRYETAAPLTIADDTPPLSTYRPLGIVRTASATAAVPGVGERRSASADTSRSLQVGTARAYVLAEERKIVTVLFADISSSEPLGASLEPQRLRAVLGSYFGVLARAIQTYGGTIDKYIGDAVMAVFGAPISHEDDAARAIRAALAIQSSAHSLHDTLEKTYGLQISIRIGINTGEVVAGLLPGEVRAYTVTGDAVNTAQRIESAAPPDQILVSASTYALARHGFVFEPVAALTLKGKAEPVPAYRVVGPERRVSPRGGSELVGRTRELAVLRDLFARVSSRRGHVLHVHGEAGVGKTRLVGEFLGSVPSGTVRIRLRSNSYESETPYALIADLLRRVFALRQTDDEATARAALAAGIDEFGRASRASATELFLELLGYGTPSSLDPEAKRRLLLALLRRLLSYRSADKPLVLVVEDLHWVDATSAAMLSELTQHASRMRVLFISTGRESANATWTTERLPLEPLGSDAAAEMVSRVAHVVLDEKTRALVLERTAGNPFFIEETMRALATGATATVPSTVQELLEARLDRLDEHPRRAAHGASVIGREFAVSVLARIATGIELDPALRTLETERFIAPRTASAERSYAFRHALVQEVAYKTQLVSQRRRTHVLVGDALSGIYADRLDELTYPLAYHYGRGDDDVKARAALLRAGRRAQHLYAKDEALGYFRSALERGGGDSETRTMALEGMGDIQRLAAAYPDALASYTEARMAAGDARLDRCRLLRKTGGIHVLRGDLTAAMIVLTEALADLPENAGSETSHLLLAIGDIRWREGRYDDAIATLRQAASRADAVGDVAARAEALKELGTVYVVMGDKREGLRQYEESLALYESVDDQYGQANDLSNIGIAHRRLGEYDQALGAYARALAIRERIGDPLGVGRVRNNRADILRLRGDFEGAERDYRAALEMWETIGYSGVGLARTGLGITAVERGDLPTARRELSTALHELERVGNRTYLFDALRFLALAHVPDENDAALGWAERALETARAAKSREQEALALQALGIVQTARADVGAAIVALQASRELLERTAERHELARTLAALARAYRRLDDDDPRRENVASLEQSARTTFTELGATHDLRRLEGET
jgi:adenylate cyclase